MLLPRKNVSLSRQPKYTYPIQPYLNMQTPISRRASIRSLALTLGALWTWPALGQEPALDFFPPAEKKLLDAVLQTLIPAGNGHPGALDVGVDDFLLRLLRDCYDEETQRIVRQELRSLDTYAKDIYQQSFPDCTSDQRTSLLIRLSAPSSEDSALFFTWMRREVIRGYTTSSYVMQEHYGYEVAPGYYHGCVPLTPPA